ncbi:PspA/IM30 family protein [Lederbergia lenta]|uniref:Modulator of lia operon expression n=1 Tax=Lederbergia lenta TaxID=1467 RepID=A0A2X4WBN5_LEDLE|nr:PspA/IM30 family protein [Lederbergia lenta]MCM3110306.1 PspA/IM30 family protein [Lederbergia lenta]MEC2324126.1 PspA/IM30 family protein [Lederbergia lenta]SQI60571.1 modulator of lia operon expression [Lederbergia lenta]
MTNIFEKIKESIATEFSEVSTIKEAQNPITLLNKYVRESEAEVEKAGKLIERQRMLKDEFYKELRIAQSLTDKRKEQVNLATEANAHDLAETALRYQVQAEQQVERLTQSYETALKQLGDLEQKHEEMKFKVKDMHIKRLELMGRENILSMKEKMNKVLDESEFGNAAEKFENIESTLKQKEANVDNEYEITVFDAKIQKLAKELNNVEKQKNSIENVVQ